MTLSVLYLIFAIFYTLLMPTYFIHRIWFKRHDNTLGSLGLAFLTVILVVPALCFLASRILQLPVDEPMIFTSATLLNAAGLIHLSLSYRRRVRDE